MRFCLHDYQAYAIQYIKDHRACAVFLDMGLGKTVITLSAIRELSGISKVLVIAPLRVAVNTWPTEIEKWDHTQDMSYAVCVGTPKQRLTALKSDAHITIINRENLDWLVNKSRYTFDFDCVVIDELSSFKSHKSARVKALLKVRPQIDRIIGLTGTPTSKGLMDLWSEFKVLDMGERLGKYITYYRNKYFTPDRRNGNIVYSWKPLRGAEDAIYDKISDMTISMRATDHLRMPELISTEYKVTLSKPERDYYKKLKEDLIIQAGDDCVTAGNAGVLAGKLAQFANGAIYTDDGNVLELHNRKIDALEDIIESANGRPLLVAYWFKHDLARIRDRFEVREMKTVQDIADWNAGRIPVAVVHPASAGHGLNLQAGGSNLVWFGLPWSLELYQQTNARLWRQGQASHTVVIQHIITHGSIDGRIMDALAKRETTQASLINAVRIEMGR